MEQLRQNPLQSENRETLIQEIISSNLLKITQNTEQGLEGILESDQLEQSIEQEFRSIGEKIKNALSQENTQETRADILNVIEQTTDNPQIAQWLCKKMSIDYQSLKNEIQKPFSLENLIEENTSIGGSNSIEQNQDAISPLLTVSSQDFEVQKAKVETNLIQIQDTYQRAIAHWSENLKGEEYALYKSPEIHSKMVQILLETIRQDYLKKGYLPEYEKTVDILLDNAQKTNVFKKGLSSFMGMFRQEKETKIDSEYLKDTLKSSLLRENIPQEYTKNNNILRSCYENGTYERLQKNQNIFIDKYSNRDLSSLSDKELEYHLAYTKSQVELLETVDEHVPEAYKTEYEAGVLSGSIGIVYEEWVVKEKIPNMSSSEKMSYRVNRMMKPFQKTLTLIGNIFKKLFNVDSEMSWSDVFTMDKKKENKTYTEAQKKHDEVQRFHEKQSTKKECLAFSAQENPSHSQFLENADLSQLKDYSECMKNAYSFHETTGEKIQTSFEQAQILQKINKGENVILLHYWIKKGWASLIDGNINIGESKFPLSDSSIERHKGEFIKESRMGQLWPDNILFEFHTERTQKTINPKNENEQNRLQDLHVLDMYTFVKTFENENVKKFLSLANNKDFIEQMKDKSSTERTISLSLLQDIAQSKKSIDYIGYGTTEEQKQKSKNAIMAMGSSVLGFFTPKEETTDEIKSLYTVCNGEAHTITSLHDIQQYI